MENLISTFHTGPVTSLSVVGNKIIAGVGSSLYTYCKETCCCKQKIADVLQNTNIHGIRPSTDGSLCVFGGKSLRVVGNQSAQLESAGDVIIVSDWVWDVAWIYQDQNEAEENIVVVTAHNVVQRLDSKNGTVLQSVACVENCILYCSRFIGRSWQDLIVAAGTVFNQVLLWSPNGQANVNGQALVMTKLVGHEGVIFSIEYCPSRQWICSVSDDRSIRVWQLKFPTKVCGVVSLEQWSHCVGEQIQVLYGHSARVWDVKILPNCLVSIGEDSTCCVWSEQGQITHRFKGHKGKSIWSLAVEKSGKFAVTGGGDYSIRVWKLDTPQESTSFVSKSLDIDQQTEKDFPRVVTMLDWDSIVVMTDEGCLLHYSVQNSSWKTLMRDRDYRSYTVVAVCTFQCNLIALGNIQGTLRIVQHDILGSEDTGWSLCDWKVHDGKIFSVNWLSVDRLLTTGPDGIMKCWKLKDADIEVTHQLVLPACRHRWVSAACLTDELLVCGDRGGSVHVYQTDSSQDKDESQMPVQTFPKIHGKTGVTDVCCHGENIYTAGRDGCYNQYKLAGDRLELLHSNKIQKGFDWLDKIDIERKDGDTLIYGFHSNNFVLWSVQNNNKLVEIPCGGGHRSWGCHIHDNMLRFAYVKTGEVVFCQAKLSSNQVILKESIHGREITGVQHLLTFYSDKERKVEVIATCSEDTSIQVLSVCSNQFGVKDVKVVKSLQGHISNVRTLAQCHSGLPWKQKDCNRKLLFSGGGRAQLIVWRITLSDPSKHKELKENFAFEMLCNYKIDNGGRKHNKPWKYNYVKHNPETRFMDLSVITAQEVYMAAPSGVHIITAACSDSFVRFYSFCERERTLKMLVQSSYHDHCVLKAHNIVHKSYNTKHVLALTAGTDGCIAFWDISDLCCSLTESDDLCKARTPTKQCDNSGGIPKVKKEGAKSSLSSEDIAMDNKTSSEEQAGSITSLTQHLTGDSLSSECHTMQNSSEERAGFSSSSSEVESKRETTTEKDDLRPLFVSSCHQSGINSLDSFNIKGTSQYIICSGGDDNAISLSRITIATESSGAMQITTDLSSQELNAHSAQITGIHIMDRDHVLSASVDQRICLWKITPEFKLQQKWCKFVDVSDLSCTAVWTSNRLNVLAAGVGLEILQTKEEDRHMNQNF